ncbi:unnamed protein product [Sphacelaria rigidula]
MYGADQVCTDPTDGQAKMDVRQVAPGHPCAQVGWAIMDIKQILDNISRVYFASSSQSSILVGSKLGGIGAESLANQNKREWGRRRRYNSPRTTHTESTALRAR